VTGRAQQEETTMAWDTDADLKRLQVAMQSFDKAGVTAFCEDLLARVYAAAEAYPPRPATKLLSLLRKRRFFEQMERLADALIQTGSANFSVRRLYAQALLDQGHFTAAQQTLDTLVADTEGRDADENAEARGLVGRLYKQMYINAAAPALPRTQDWLARSAAAYFGPYQVAPEQHDWHGINVVAVAHRSQRDNVPLNVPGIPLPLTLAQAILERIEARDAVDNANLWSLGTAVEASLALGKSCKALDWARKYVEDSNCNAFEAASTLRQLEEVWQLPRDSSSTEDRHCEESILSLLRATVLGREGGSLSADGASVRAELGELQHTDLEKVFGAERYVSLDWYRRGLARCAAVARIGRETSRGVGTGFLVRGSSLHASLGEELYLLTNAHVVSPKPEVPIAITPAEAVVTFEGLADAEGQTWRLTEVVYSSPIGEFDATLLRLDRPVAGVEPYPIAARMPPLGAAQRVYVVGHPLGGGLSFSMQDNLLIDWDERKVHYRTPTEPGSSGSPVFNDQWELIALHHAGRSDMRKLHDQMGSYEANEGINILAIRDGLARTL
jgi:S1-C subfamily serine protease